MISFKEHLLEEPLTVQQRMKRSRTMKRLSKKISAKRKIAMKKKATTEKLEKRAQKKARDLVRQKFMKGKSYNDLSNAEKIQLDKKVEKKKALISKLAKRILPKIRKAEGERLKNKNK